MSLIPTTTHANSNNASRVNASSQVWSCLLLRLTAQANYSLTLPEVSRHSAATSREPRRVSRCQSRHEFTALMASDINVHLERCQSFRKSVKENPHIPRKESSPALSPWFSETLLNFSPLWCHKQLWSLTDLCLISRRLQREDKIWGF